MKNNPMPFPSRVLLLYYSFAEPRGQSGTSPSHIHGDHWQLEIAIRGNFFLKLAHETLQLEPGMMVLIPPGMRHEFHYPAECRAFVSVKFQLDELFNSLPFGVVRESPAANYFREEIVRLTRCAATRENNTILEYLLADLFELHFRSYENTGPELLRRIDELIFSAPGERASVKTIAARLGYSTVHLSRVTQRYCHVSLKQYIDRKIFVLACRHLIYSERTISEVAAELGFADIFSFSRFFSRMNNGEPPSLFRLNPNRPRKNSLR